MNFVLLKQAGVFALTATNTVLLGLAITSHRKKRGLPAAYDRLLPVSPVIALFQLSIGLYFLLQGLQPHLQHVFYGSLVALGAVSQLMLRPNTATGQRYRAKPLIHAAAALFVALLAVRSWMSG